ncbi:MAG: hypothetical protein WCJ87_04005, partial [Burkholderiales bacterium]
DGRRWDAGMVMYEFTSFRQPGTTPELASYDPLQRNDIGRFCGVVRDYVEGRQATRAVEPHRCGSRDGCCPTCCWPMVWRHCPN